MSAKKHSERGRSWSPGSRRPYGTGCLYVRVDTAGCERWYGKWREGGVQIKRRIGVKSDPWGVEVMTHLDAELELRAMMGLLPRGGKATVRAGSLAGAYSHVRRALQELDRRGNAPPRVMAALYEAEDALVVEMGVEAGGRRLGDDRRSPEAPIKPGKVDVVRGVAA